MRAEWCKARARAQCWTEEVQLLEEEKRRSLVSLEHLAKLWDDARHARSREPLPQSNEEPMDQSLDEGLVAYASRQAGIYRQIACDFVECWDDTKETKRGKKTSLSTAVGEDGVAEELVEIPVIDETTAEEDLYHI